LHYAPLQRQNKNKNKNKMASHGYSCTTYRTATLVAVLPLRVLLGDSIEVGDTQAALIMSGLV
jgi:hypothetical protein